MTALAFPLVRVTFDGQTTVEDWDAIVDRCREDEPRELQTPESAQGNPTGDGESPTPAAHPSSGHESTPAPTRAPEHGPRARNADPATAKAAAASAGIRAGTSKAKLLAAFRAHPEGLTAQAASELAGVPYQTASKRVHELRDEDRLLERAGFTRATAFGRQADVLVIAADATEAIGKSVAA